MRILLADLRGSLGRRGAFGRTVTASDCLADPRGQRGQQHEDAMAARSTGLVGRHAGSGQA
ncbi:hypothetical protein BJF90_23965 [Pseudonocardia sp. CNS-004]|nr:hypothetical protein BJF90_23965 [Pseudonocardia sp. CNS-004]